MQKKQLFSLAGLLALIFWLGAPAFAQGKPKDLKRDVQHELWLLPYYNVFDWLEFELQDEDTLVLHGQVLRPTTKSEAQARLERLPGVEKVINQIEVLPLSPNDNRLRRNLYRALFNGDSPLFHYGTQPVPSIHILVKNGHVTLKGLVARKADSQYAYLKANSISGSFSVKNELQVEAVGK